MTDDRPWVKTQTEPCEECRFDPTDLGPEDVAAAVRDLGRKYRMPLSRFLPGEDGDALLRTRSAPDVWSPLEYACHVRDVLAVFAERTQRTLVEDDPDYGWWDHEAAVTDEDYNGQDPPAVADALTANAEAYAAVLDTVPFSGWKRTGRRRGGEPFTVLGLARFAIHEGRHHLLDVGRGTRAARGR
jgi:hypothetical protein